MSDPKDVGAKSGATRGGEKGDEQAGAGRARREAARTTIVGGQPDGNARELPPIPVGLEHLMGLAAASPEFAEALTRDRRTALEATGLELTESEQAILSAVPAPALGRMIAQVEERLGAPDRRRFLEQAALALAALLGTAAGVGAAGCSKKAEPSSGGKKDDSPDKPGTPEPERPEPGTEPGTEATRPAADAPPPPAAQPDAAVARPAPESPERLLAPAAMDEHGMHRPGPTRPADISSLRERPDHYPPTKGIQPKRPEPREGMVYKTRGIRPDRIRKLDEE